MDTTLFDVIKTQKLSNDVIRFLIYQILRGLKYLHSAKIIHKVILKLLKPLNIYNFKIIYLRT